MKENLQLSYSICLTREAKTRPTAYEARAAASLAPFGPMAQESTAQLPPLLQPIRPAPC